MTVNWSLKVIRVTGNVWFSKLNFNSHCTSGWENAWMKCSIQNVFISTVRYSIQRTKEKPPTIQKSLANFSRSSSKILITKLVQYWDMVKKHCAMHWTAQSWRTPLTIAVQSATVQTFNSCTRCPGIIHDRAPDLNLVSWAWMISQLNVALIRNLHVRGSLICRTFVVTCYAWVFVQPDPSRHPDDWWRN